MPVSRRSCWPRAVKPLAAGCYICGDMALLGVDRWRLRLFAHRKSEQFVTKPVPNCLESTLSEDSEGGIAERERLACLGSSIPNFQGNWHESSERSPAASPQKSAKCVKLFANARRTEANPISLDAAGSASARCYRFNPARVLVQSEHL